MTRGEGTALGVAVVGHAILFGLLSVGFLSTPNPLNLKSKPIDISLVDEIAAESAAPQTVEPPAQSVAPDTGPPEDAPPPTELAEAAPDPTPPAPQPEPAPAPKPEPAPRKPAPKKPAPEKPKPAKAEPKREASPAKSKPSPAKSRGSDENAKATRPRGSRLGDDFLKGIADTPSKSKSQTPRAQNVSAQAVASLGDAIQRQVQPCANRIPNPGPGANQIRSKIRLQMKPNGTLASRPSLRGQTGVNSENQRYAQRVAELAMSAIIQCAPYKLPAELYEGGWEDIIINYKLPD